jgi:hypothetical protein
LTTENKNVMSRRLELLNYRTYFILFFYYGGFKQCNMAGFCVQEITTNQGKKASRVIGKEVVQITLEQWFYQCNEK